jgi:hypothetical protein
MDTADVTAFSDYALLDLWYALEPTESGTSPAADVLAEEIERRGLSS